MTNIRTPKCASKLRGSHSRIYARELQSDAWANLSAHAFVVEVSLRAYLHHKGKRLPGTDNAYVSEINEFEISVTDFAKLGRATPRDRDPASVNRRAGMRIKDELVSKGFLEVLRTPRGRAPGLYALTRWRRGDASKPGSCTFLHWEADDG